MKSLTKLLCKLGIHKWGHYTPAVYRDAMSERHAVSEVDATRTCLRCDLKQAEDRHCLGLNPPEYYSTWYDL